MHTAEDTDEALRPLPSTAYWPVRQGRSLLERVHDASTLPWCVTIPAVTFAFRLALTLPASVKAQRGRAKLTALKPILENARREMPQLLNHRLRRTQMSEKDRQKLFKHHVNVYLIRYA